LVFGNNGLPQRHLLRVLKKRAEEAGLDPKKCVLHRFRHTFACMHLRAGVDIKTVSDWLGHSDLATTAIYLKKIQSESDATKAMVDRTFA
jgi:site-specific recombinase XerD